MLDSRKWTMSPKLKIVFDFLDFSTLFGIRFVAQELSDFQRGNSLPEINLFILMVASRIIQSRDSMAIDRENSVVVWPVE